MPLAMLLLAPVADHVPVQLIFGVAGLLTVLTSGVWAILLRTDRSAEGPATLPA